MWNDLTQAVTTRSIVILARAGLITAGIAIFVAMVGPFEHIENEIVPWDKAGHFMAFYVIAAVSLIAFPKVRRGDMALGIVAFAILTEVGQWFVGRDFELGDIAANVLGMVAALAPSYFERLRFYARRAPFHSFADINALDPRRREEAAAMDGIRNARRRARAEASR
jgi:VanZ family protein